MEPGYLVSIHAPRAGRDAARDVGSTAPKSFNPRAPRGARPDGATATDCTVGFQSTRPARGATRQRGRGDDYGHVSIHAPRAGRDATLRRPRKRRRKFQSTRPARGATTYTSAAYWALVVSIHAPRAGRDWAKHFENNRSRVSIHAPRAGRDKTGSDYLSGMRFQSTRPARGATSPGSRMGSDLYGFNPRAPRGARLGIAGCTMRLIVFQSTRPARGATNNALQTEIGRYVSIHAPRAGRDNTSGRSPRTRRCFNPRAPRGARRAGLVARRIGYEFQSTRPARGATPSKFVYVPYCAFQSTRPARGATRYHHQPHGQLPVSIHAPRAGRDATVRGHAARWNVSIHAPRAGRDVSQRSQGRLRRVSIHAPRAGRDSNTPVHGLTGDMFQSTRPARGATTASTPKNRSR